MSGDPRYFSLAVRTSGGLDMLHSMATTHITKISQCTEHVHFVHVCVLHTL